MTDQRTGTNNCLFVTRLSEHTVDTLNENLVTVLVVVTFFQALDTKTT